MSERKFIQGPINIENTKLMYRNFEGRQTDFNNLGDRNFCVIIDSATAIAMKEDGWNIKYTKPRHEDDEPTAYLKVNVKYDENTGRGPVIYLISDTNKTKRKLPPEAVKMLDWADIKKADVSINPYNWERSGRHGVSAYLKALYVTVVEDAFSDEYSDFDEM